MKVRRLGFRLSVALPVIALAGMATLVHLAARDHVAHYTGDTPRTSNCVSCHFDARGGTALDRILKPRYLSPLNLAVSADGSLLLVTAQEAGTLLVVDAREGRLLQEIAVGQRPHSVIFAPGERAAYVSNEHSDTVSEVDLATGGVRYFEAGKAPTGLALEPRSGTMFVANWFGDDLSVIDVRSGEEVTRLAAGSNPVRVAPVPGGGLLVANQLSRVAPYPSPPLSEVTLVDARERRVRRRFEIRNAHQLEGVAVTPDGEMALVTLVRPKNLLPAVAVARGWMMTAGLAVIDLRGDQVTQVLLDEPNAYYADPNDVVITPDGLRAFVSHSGADVISVIDLPRLRALVRGASPAERDRLANHLGASRGFVVKRIATGASPKGLAVSPDGRRVYVAERLEDRIAVVDAETLEVVSRIDLGGPRHQSLVRRGEKVFNSARFTFQGQFSCRSCHPSNHVDRLQYDLEPDGLGRNIVDNRSLLDIADTGPFKWNGKNTSLYMQCGIRFARFLMRVQPFSSDELNALVAFLNSLEPVPSGRPAGAELTPAQARGREIFERPARRDGTPIAERERCVTCHVGPRYTHLRREEVGSASPTDSERAFDTPQLTNVGLTAPYLHDGKAATLEEIWTVYSPQDTHGVTSDLGKSGLNDLIEFLRTL